MKRRKFINITALATLGLGFEAFTLQGKTHILTLSFDDGFRKSFYRIAEIQEEYGLKACMNVIASGHLKGFNTEPKWIPQHLLGDFGDWNLLKIRGHEIMPSQRFIWTKPKETLKSAWISLRLIWWDIGLKMRYTTSPIMLRP